MTPREQFIRMTHEALSATKYRSLSTMEGDLLGLGGPAIMLIYKIGDHNRHSALTASSREMGANADDLAPLVEARVRNAIATYERGATISST